MKAILIFSAFVVAAYCAKTKPNHAEGLIKIDDGGLSRPNPRDHDHNPDDVIIVKSNENHDGLKKNPEQIEDVQPVAFLGDLSKFMLATAENCAHLECTEHEDCMVNSDRNEFVCIPHHIVKTLHQHQKNEKMQKHQQNLAQKKDLNSAGAHLKARQLKDNAKYYEKNHKATMKKRLEHSKVSFDYTDNDHINKKGYFFKKSQKTESVTVTEECSNRDIEGLSRHLLTHFKRQQNKEKRQQKRSSHKKELRDNSECRCLSAVRHQFARLDADVDGHLSLDEVVNQRGAGRRANCMSSLLKTCDHNSDGSLSSEEWCCCFANVVAPCEALKNKAESSQKDGLKTMAVGAYVPQCDEDGFFRHVQCHSSTGMCWCSRLDGTQLPNTETRGTPNCKKLRGRLGKRGRRLQHGAVGGHHGGGLKRQRARSRFEKRAGKKHLLKQHHSGKALQLV